MRRATMAPMTRTPHQHSRRPELHRSERVGWLRAAVLGANDGIVSVAGLVVGVAAGGVGHGAILAAGEYVSVQSQADTERADIDAERRELSEEPEAELEELARIYRHRGLEPALARQVAEQLTDHDALGAHARDELGLSESLRARPVQAALASAAAFCAGAALPLAAILLAPPSHTSAVVMSSTVAGLLLSGALAAWAGGAPILRGALRVAFWGVLAMAAAHGIGSLFDVAV